MNTRAEQDLYLTSCPGEKKFGGGGCCATLCLNCGQQAANVTLLCSFRLPDSNGFQFALYLLAECGLKILKLVVCAL